MHAAFLRGINLASRRRVGAEELRSCFEEMGFRDVSTYRTSGNVVFAAGREPRAKITRRIEEGLVDSFGFEVTVFLRTAAEIRGIATHQPFSAGLVATSKGKLQVALLGAKPAAALQRKALAVATDDDRLAFGDRELYWLPSGGTRDSKLGMKGIESLVGPATMRTKDTLDRLAEKYFD
jgi:uncharacterized protein (DUF1697 family)